MSETLDRCITRRGGSLRIVVRNRGARLSRSVKIIGGDVDAALQKARKLRDWIHAEWPRVVSQYDHANSDDADYVEPFRNARKRPNYHLTREDEQRLIRESQGRCALTGLPFRGRCREFRRNPYGVSVDRVDSSRGYTPDNTRLVLVAVNLAMNEWGEDVFRQIAHAYLLAGHNSGLESITLQNVVPPETPCAVEPRK
jgi:hypothetical protein